MRCPFCGAMDTAVRDSRPAEESNVVRRRRYCSKCGGRFTTFERVHLRDLIVVKRDGRKTNFERDKLLKSIQIALRKRPVDEESLDQLVSGLVRRLENSNDSEVSSKTIGHHVLEALEILDPVAYVRYASVYRDFKDPKDFAHFIENSNLGNKE